MAVQNDLAAIVAQPSSLGRAGEAGRARDLAAEAYEIGRAEAAAEAHKALGKAWGAFLENITTEQWIDIRFFAPETYARFRRVILGRQP
jgi:hypothetical protein